MTLVSGCSLSLPSMAPKVGFSMISEMPLCGAPNVRAVNRKVGHCARKYKEMRSFLRRV
jgi:hypothetical protein